MIEVSNLKKIFRTEEVETWALSDVSFTVADATVVMVTHSRHDASYASRIINLFDGSIVKELPQ